MINNYLFTLFLLHHIGNIYSLSGPSNVIVTSSSETGVEIQWSPIYLTQGLIKGYHVSAEPLKWFGSMKPPSGMEWTYTNNTKKAELLQLHPGTRYHISVWATTDKGDTDKSETVVWTEIGDPDPPPPVEVLETDGTTMKVKLHSGTSNYGPILHYLVIVLEKTLLLASIDSTQLYNFSYAEYIGHPYYVTANLTEDNIALPFVVGDGEMYNGFHNVPLDRNTEYEVVQGVESRLNGVTKMSFSPLESYYRPIKFNRFKSQESVPSTLTSALVIAICVFGFLLVTSIVIYFLLRHHYGKRRTSDEIVLQMQDPEVEENGFIPSSWQVDDETSVDDFYDCLKEKFWQIPRHQLHIHEAVLGAGKYGEVHRGTVSRKGQELAVLVQETQTQDTLSEKEWKCLLSELNAAIRLGLHPNIVEFIGMCEERENTTNSTKRLSDPLIEKLDWVVEHHSKSLKEALLDSRKVVQGRATTFTEKQLVEIALGISRGLCHLASYRICHCHLSSYAIVMTDQLVPKITNFGFSYYCPPSKRPDLVRWKSPEALRSSKYHWKSDVWSFGVILWEIFTLGGTPYVDVRREDVTKMVMNGIRLPHPRGISDELFQMMLHCWETDLDERTSFQDLSGFFELLLGKYQDHVNLHPSIIQPYHRYDPVV